MSERRVWHNDHHDKESWGVGPWTDEPDKVSWVDEETGLDCMIVRNYGGALCGYVGVPETHPLFGVGYSEESEKLQAALEARMNEPLGENVGLGVMLAVLTDNVKPTPETVFTVHGGLTFADACHEPTPEEYDSIGERIAARTPDAEKYPDGDSARAVDRLVMQATLSYPEWVRDQMGRRICHLPEPGRPEKVWWFGFDCAHAGDVSPGHNADMKRFVPDAPSVFRGGTYREVAYVENEVRSLARQLALIQ